MEPKPNPDVVRSRDESSREKQAPAVDGSTAVTTRRGLERRLANALWMAKASHRSRWLSIGGGKREGNGEDRALKRIKIEHTADPQRHVVGFWREK
jgi:hypothetical protein